MPTEPRQTPVRVIAGEIDPVRAIGVQAFDNPDDCVLIFTRGAFNQMDATHFDISPMVSAAVAMSWPAVIRLRDMLNEIVERRSKTPTMAGTDTHQ